MLHAHRHLYVLNTVHAASTSRVRVAHSISSSSLSTSVQQHPASLDPTLPDAPKLPRWVRRQNLQEAKVKQPEVTLAKEPPRFRSKHLDPEAEKKRESAREGLKLLEPHVLSQRLKKLCDRGKLDEAVSLLKNSPLDAQNTPVWNTLIWEAMKAKRYKLAHSLFTDMKRRGHSPTTRTFLTIFNGLARIDDFSRHTKQLENARSIYVAYSRYTKSIKRMDAHDPELSVDPLAPYIKILGNARCYAEMFDVFYALDSEGPLSPNQLIFTAIFQVLAGRSTAEIRRSDVATLWSQVKKKLKQSPNFTIDAHLATAAISALTRGQTSDHDLAFQIAREYFGLCPPGIPRISSTFPLSAHSLSTILHLCNVSNNYDLCIDFFNQVKRRPEDIGGASILDRLHLEEVLRAYQALAVPSSAYQSLQTLEWMLRQELTGPNGGKIRPELPTFNIVLQSCWHSADWNSATRTFDLMTGYHSHDFMDGAVADVPRFDQRGKGRNIVPTAETVSSLVRTAYKTKNRAHMRQCLRIVDYLGIDTLLSKSTADPDEGRKVLKDRGFYVTKLAQAVVEMVEFVLSGPTEQKYAEQQKRWKVLATRAKLELQESSEEALIPTLHKPLNATSLPVIKEVKPARKSWRSTRTSVA